MSQILSTTLLATFTLCCLILHVSFAHKYDLPFPFNSASPYVRFSQRNHANPANLTYPVWPKAFSTTLPKLDPESKVPIYTKLFFQYPYSRFYFYTHYYTMNETWGQSTYEVLFTEPNVFYHIYPQERKCDISPSRIPTISTHWLALTEYQGKKMVRDMIVEEWKFPDDIPSVGGMRYFTRDVLDGVPGVQRPAGFDTRVPVRSVNQDEDPGVTDYMDFQIGDQDEKHWVVPDYCPPVPESWKQE